MALILYGFSDRPDDFAATKVGAALGECDFLLDFTRPLETIHWFGKKIDGSVLKLASWFQWCIKAKREVDT